MLTDTSCTDEFWYAIGGQHIYTAAMQHRKDKESKNHPVPIWTRQFEGFEVRRDTPLPIRRKLAGLQQVQTTSSSVSTTSERMALLPEHIAEDPDAPLLTHTQNMLAEIGITADEGNVVCSTFRLCPLHIIVSLFFLPVSCCLKVTVAKRWAGLGNLVKFIGQPAVDAVYGMEKRDVEPALGVFKECEGLMPDRLSSIVLYMSGTKSTVMGIKREIKLATVEQLWGWHVLHPDAVTERFVHESRGMLHYSAL